MHDCAALAGAVSGTAGVDGGAQVLRWLAAGTDLSMVGGATGVLSGPRGAGAYAVLAAWDAGDRRDDVLRAMRVVGERLVAQVQ